MNKVYIEVIDRTHKAILDGFSSSMKFEDGLKLLWINRYRYSVKHPDDFYFTEQFINSPLINKLNEKENQGYKKQLEEFYNHAIKNNEILKLPIEVYWTIAFAPLYHLIKFRLHSVAHPIPTLNSSEKTLSITLKVVLKALMK